MSVKEHWEQVYATRPVDAVSWYQPHAGLSMRNIRATGAALSAPILDVGGGASVLVDDLLDAGYSDVSVLDVSAAALAHAQRRLGPRANGVGWIVADITTSDLPADCCEIWHDRAAFHFLTQADQRAAYRVRATRAIRSGGALIVSTFAEDGPERCSGLPVVRYDARTLSAALGDSFALAGHDFHVHTTPGGNAQRFLIATFRKIAA